MSGRVLRDSLPAAADRAGNWLTSSSGGPALCRLWRRSSLLCVGLRRLTHMGGRLHALLFEHPTALNPAVVDHDNAGKPVFKTDKFILMQKAPNQECHNGNLCDVRKMNAIVITVTSLMSAERLFLTAPIITAFSRLSRQMFGLF